MIARSIALLCFYKVLRLQIAALRFMGRTC